MLGIDARALLRDEISIDGIVECDARIRCLVCDDLSRTAKLLDFGINDHFRNGVRNLVDEPNINGKLEEITGNHRNCLKVQSVVQGSERRNVRDHAMIDNLETT